MTSSSLQAALRAGAGGLYALEAGTGLIIAHGCWVGRGDIDERNVALLVNAVLHASGRRQFPGWPLWTRRITQE